MLSNDEPGSAEGASQQAQDETVPDPVSKRIWRANALLQGGLTWSSLPMRLNEKLPVIPRYEPVPDPTTMGTEAVTSK
jgi:hypothetical protein